MVAMPPACLRESKIVTATPPWRRKPAVERPQGPAPITATFVARAGPTCSAGSLPVSMMNRFISRMASGRS